MPQPVRIMPTRSSGGISTRVALAMSQMSWAWGCNGIRVTSGT
jgi:hypothetical protein